MIKSKDKKKNNMVANDDLVNKKRKEKFKNAFYLIIIIILLILIIILLNNKRYSSKNELALVDANTKNNISDEKFINFIYDDVSHEVPPAKDKYFNQSVSCNNASGSWDNNLWQLNISNIVDKVNCTLVFKRKNDIIVLNNIPNKKSVIKKSIIKNDNNFLNEEKSNVIITTDEIGNVEVIENDNTKDIKNKMYSSNTNIISIKSSDLNIEYRNDKNDYEIVVSDNVDKISFDILLEDSNAKVVKDDYYDLNYGENNIHLKIIAEDNKTTKDINIKVFRNKNLTDIILEKSNIYIGPNESRKIDYLLNPINTTYKDLIFESDDENIVKVDNNGFIYSQNSSGNAKITIKSKYFPNISKDIVINVEEDKIITSIYKINRENIPYVYEIELLTKIGDFINNFDNDFKKIRLYDSSNSDITNIAKYVGTGMKIEFINNVSNDILDIVVLGDINGDGKCNATDFNIIKRYLDNKTELSDIQRIAADVNKDNIIDVEDQEMIRKYNQLIISSFIG